jgi:hypothetical protein
VGGLSRPGGLAAARLTARDRALLERLGEHEPLTTCELRLLFFTGESRCRRRLRTLEAEQLLVRVFPARPGRGGSREALWFLSSEGRRLVGAPGRRAPGLSIPDLDHRRAVARFFCTLTEHSLQRREEGLWSWRGERSCEQGLGGGARPDGYGRYLHPAGEITFYLELDRGTETQARLHAKLDSYLAQLATNKDAARANILLLVQGNRRLRRLRDPALQGPPWLWASADGNQYTLLPTGEERPFIELPAWPRDPAKQVAACLGRRWQLNASATRKAA